MLCVMADETVTHKIQGVLDRTGEFLSHSIDHVVGIRDDVMNGLRDLYDELSEVRRELTEVLTANDAITVAYKKSRKELANAELTENYDLQSRMYDEAERYPVPGATTA